jgi:hypothetical protein
MAVCDASRYRAFNDHDERYHAIRADTAEVADGASRNSGSGPQAPCRPSQDTITNTKGTKGVETPVDRLGAGRTE